VVDNWDALTSDRPYRKAWSAEKTIAFLKENAGKMFDPKVVDVFLSIVSEENQNNILTIPVAKNFAAAKPMIH
jgi:HD-GYP domain-containing protein (c-di-GMP phosphodiesterase class II)